MPGGRQWRIKTIQKSATISYVHMVGWVRTAAGKSLNVMLQVNQGDTGAVLGKVVREGTPKRLQAFDVEQLPALVEAT